MKRLILTIFATYALAAQSQVTIEQGAVVHLSKGTQMICSNVSMAVEGELVCDTSSIAGFGGAGNPCLSALHLLALHTLRIDGEAAISASNINIAGDMVMNGRGVVNLQHSAVRLHGSILNENEESYVTGGRIEKMLPPSSGRAATGVGINLSFAAANSYDSLLLIRTHEPWYYKGEYSISKAYSFSEPMQLAAVDIAYLQAQSPKSTDTYLIYYRAPQGVGVENVPSETNAATKRVVSKNSDPFEAEQVTIFPFPDLKFSKAITPNSDGINDCFEVTGIEKFTNARLVVLLPNGNIVYDLSPYSNNFCGEGFATGTYYYMFFAEKNDSKPLKRGFFELVKEE
jgi:gliding motility-associated-like protein